MPLPKDYQSCGTVSRFPDSQKVSKSRQCPTSGHQLGALADDMTDLRVSHTQSAYAFVCRFGWTLLYSAGVFGWCLVLTVDRRLSPLRGACRRCRETGLHDSDPGVAPDCVSLERFVDRVPMSCLLWVRRVRRRGGGFRSPLYGPRLWSILVSARYRRLDRPGTQAPALLFAVRRGAWRVVRFAMA